MATVSENTTETLLKIPPHSIGAERSVLGGLMLDESAWDNIAGVIAADDFYRSDHRTIFRCIESLVEKNQPLDVITISDALDHVNALETIGGVAYISDLAENTPTASNIQAYAKTVQERATIRKLILAGQEIADSGFNPAGRDSATLINEAESRVFRIGDEKPSSGGPEAVRPLLAKAISRIEELYDTKGALTGISTGFKDLDAITSGLQAADLVVVAGRPSMGKTSLMMNMAESAAISGNMPVLVFSLEMPADSLILRMLSSLGRIDQSRIRTGQLYDDDWPNLTSAVSLLNDCKLFVDDTAALTPNDIRARTRRIAREHGQLGLILVDYLQLMQVPGTVENRAGEISEISRSLKAIAKEFNCPLVAGSQLNRSLEQRPDKRPIMSDLRESGAIEQDADVIMGIYRDEVYNDETENKGVAEIIILKQRNGPIGRKKLTFLGEYTRFDDMAQEFDYPDSGQSAPKDLDGRH